MKNIIIVILVMALAVVLIVFAAPIRGAINSWVFGIKKVDEVTDYGTLKNVEDTARSMQASYKADKQRYLQYKDSEDKDEKRWSNEARNKANSTAASYNEFILKNSYIWKAAMPPDIQMELPLITD